MATPVQTTETNNEVKALTDEERAAGIAKLDGMAKDAVLDAIAKIERLNQDVKTIRDFSADKKDEKLVIQEIIARNPGNDPTLKKIGDQIEKLNDQIEKLTRQAWDIAKQYEPEKLSVQDVQKLYDQTSDHVAAIRAARQALEFFSNFAGQDLLQLLPEAETTRGLRRPGDVAAGQKPSYSKMFILKKDEKNEDGTPVREQIYKEIEKDGKKVQITNTTHLANTLSSRAGRGVKVSSSEITSQFIDSLKAAGKSGDLSTLTSGVQYPFTFTKEIKNSDGKVIETKSWDLVFEK